MSTTLRNSLWNYTISLFDTDEGDWYTGAKAIAQFFRRSPVDELPVYDLPCRDWVKDYFFSLEWSEVYDLVEFLATNYEQIIQNSRSGRPEHLRTVFNKIFEAEMSGYRFIAGVLMPISSV